MSATALGTTGIWGIDQDETGVLISDIAFDFSIQDKPVLNRVGEVQGLSLYGAKCDIKYSGLFPSINGFATKLGSTLVLVNDIPDLMPAAGGLVVVMGASVASAAEDWKKLDVTAVNHPSLVAAA